MEEDFDWSPYLEDGEVVLWQGRPRRGWFAFGFMHGFCLVGLIALTLASGLMAFAPFPGAALGPVVTAPFWAYVLIERRARRRTRFAVTQSGVLLGNADTGRLVKQHRLTADSKVLPVSSRSFIVAKTTARRAPTLVVVYEAISMVNNGIGIGPLGNSVDVMRIVLAQIRAAREDADG